jgi:hypothetical protein
MQQFPDRPVAKDAMLRRRRVTRGWANIKMHWPISELFNAILVMIGSIGLLNIVDVT